MCNFVQEIYLDANVFKKCISFYSRYKFFLKVVLFVKRKLWSSSKQVIEKKLISYIFSDALVSCNLLKFTMWSLNGTFNFWRRLQKKKIKILLLGVL